MNYTNWTKYSTDCNDFIIVKWDNIVVPEWRYIDKRISYLQNEVHKNSCSIHWVMTTMANNFNIIFSLRERKLLWSLAIQQWTDPEVWWYMNKAVKLVIDYVKKFKGIDLLYYRIHYTQYAQMAESRFNLACWFRMRKWFAKDRFDNCIVGEDYEEYWDRTYWHLVSFYWDDWLYYVDNYSHKCNETKIVNLEQMVKAGIIFENAYLFTYSNPVRKFYNGLTYKEKIQKLKERF